MQTNLTTEKRLDFLDGLRGLAAVYIVIHHMRQASITLMGDNISNPSLVWFQFGHLIVALFLMISGYSLALPLIRAWNKGRDWRGAADFYRRRARRLLPVYYASLGIDIFLICTHIITGYGPWAVMTHLTPLGIIGHLLLVNNFIGGTPNGNQEINGVYWSLAVEVQICLLFPLIVLAWQRFGPLNTLAGSLVVAWTYQYLCRNEWFSPIFAGTNGHFVAVFVLGMVAAWISLSNDALAEMLRVRVSWTLFLAAGCLWFQFHPPLVGNSIMGELTICITLFFPLLMTCRVSPVVAGVFEYRWFRSLGTYSYSIYVLHMPILLIVFERVLLPRPWTHEHIIPYLIGLGLPLVLLFSYLFFLVFEKPFLNDFQKKHAAALPAALPDLISPDLQPTH